MWIGHHKEIWKLTFQVQALLGDADDMHKIRILFIMSFFTDFSSWDTGKIAKRTDQGTSPRVQGLRCSSPSRPMKDSNHNAFSQPGRGSDNLQILQFGYNSNREIHFISEWQYQRKKRYEKSLGTGDWCQIAKPQQNLSVKVLCTSLPSYSAQLSNYKKYTTRILGWVLLSTYMNQILGWLCYCN